MEPRRLLDWRLEAAVQQPVAAHGRGLVKPCGLTIAVEDEASIFELADGLDFDAAQLIAAVRHHLGDRIEVERDPVAHRNMDPLVRGICGYVSVQLTFEVLRQAEEFVVSCSAIEQQAEAG